MKTYDFLIVGAGLFGLAFAYRANKMRKSCLIIDKRNHIGGNLYCEEKEGINVHKYGAHIFHTSNKQVWDFVNDIVEFNRFTNSPIANYKGKLYNLPFNMNTFYQLWGVSRPEEAQAVINEQKASALAEMGKEGAVEPRNLEEQAKLLVGNDIYEKLIKGYTEKQWGRACKDLPAFIIKRLPVRYVFDNNYFNDTYQGIPIGGYNRLTEGLAKGSDIITGIDFFDGKYSFEADSSRGTFSFHLRKHPNVLLQSDENSEETTIVFKKMVYTGKIDEFYGYRFGRLEYRTVSFEEEVIHQPNFQGNAVMNFTESEIPFTRIIEHKHFEKFGQEVYQTPTTIISKEYPTEWKEGMEPYYPINDEKNNKLAEQYRELAAKEKNVIFGGRLAEYKYYDMAPIIEKVLGMEI